MAINFKLVTLPKATTSGYGSRELPAENLAIDRTDDRPTILWFSRLDDEENAAIEGTVFGDEALGLSLKQFRCLRIDVETIEDAKLREEYGAKTPMFVTFNPKGEVIGEISNKKVTSLSSFRKLVASSWSRVFETNHRKFGKDMKEILDRIDAVAGKRTTLQAKLERYEAKNNASKVGQVKKDLAECDAEDKQILEDEKKILDGCELRDEFRSDDAASE